MSGLIERFLQSVGRQLQGRISTPGDAGYADSDPLRPGPRHRLVMARGPWRFEKGP